MVPDFTGYVTKYGVKCSDGRTILAHAFKHNDKAQIPLVWQHQHDDPSNVLGHLVLEHRDDGVYASAFFNESEKGQQAKTLVKHKDIKNLSIYANGLKQNGSSVTHGNIREASLVMSGANPGALIDNVNIMHGDSIVESDDEVIIYTDETIQHAGSTTVPGAKKVVMKDKGPMPKPSASDPDPDGDGDNDLFDPADGGLDPNTATVQQVVDTMTPEQKNVMYALVGAAMKQDGLGDGQDGSDIDKKGDPSVTRNVFDQGDSDKKKPGSTLTHSDIGSIFQAAHKSGSLKAAVEEYALSHGIDDISTLFPYDQAVTDTPEWISRRMEWVAAVLAGTRKTPFSRIRSWTADLTLDEARAKGYVKTNLKKEQYFAVARRITTPQTIYKKQKLDRDDILDITDFDVVSWLQTEMRVMLDEELARAVLVGDGREVDDSDKISPTNVRPILGDDELYVTNLNVDLTDASSTADEIVDAIVNGLRYYRGSGNPVMYTTLPYMSRMLLAKDTLGRRLYATKVELAAAMGVADIIPCEALEASTGLIGIIVNLADYTVGADKGGEVSMFDFFDIDYNQFKYLMETRVSGAMTKYKGALTIQEFTGAGGMLPNPTAPSFVTSTGVATIPTTSHVSYVVVNDTDGTVGSALTAGAQTAIPSGTSIHFRALAASTYSFVDDANQDWTFTRS
jgi:HK97 family phage prohead protease